MPNLLVADKGGVFLASGEILALYLLLRLKMLILLLRLRP
jgi:hypothetical protein